MGKKAAYVTMREFVDKAVEFEIESAEFYHNLADLVDDSRSAEALKAFEVQERGHASTLQSYSVPRDETVRLQFGPSLSLNMPPPPKDTEISSLFDHAIEREKKSARLYDFASDLAGGDFEQLLVSLADFERGHEEELIRLRKSMGIK